MATFADPSSSPLQEIAASASQLAKIRAPDTRVMIRECTTRARILCSALTHRIMYSPHMRLPDRWGLYEPSMERDACGIGFVAHIQGHKSREIVEQALEVLSRLSHRAATGSDPDTGDGAGILCQIPHRFFKREGLRLGFD